MDTKDPINPSSDGYSFIHVIVDAFSHFVVTVPIKSNNAKTAVNTILHHWITKFGPPIYLVTDRGTEYINADMTNLCTLMGIRHAPRTSVVCVIVFENKRVDVTTLMCSDSVKVL